jgi:hypothetical protein
VTCAVRLPVILSPLGEGPRSPVLPGSSLLTSIPMRHRGPRATASYYTERTFVNSS